MIDYKIVKYCKECRERFVVNKGESSVYLCPACQPKPKKKAKK